VTLPDWLPLVLCLCAVLLTAGFRRHRLFQCSLLLALMAGSMSVDSLLRGQQAVLAFVPWLILYAAVMPETRWRARRSVIWLVALASLLVLALYAPEHVVRGLVTLGQLPFPAGRIGLGAMIVTWSGAAVLLVRWVMRGAFFDGGAAAALLVIGVCFDAAGDPVRFGFWLVCSAAAIMALVLVGSYRMAFVDGLTGLPNRRALDETLDRLSGTFAIAMVDVDHFKQFNDTHGHSAGDVVLREVAVILGRHGGGRAFRYGGEEFCLLWLDAHTERALDGCEAVRGALESASIRVRSPNAQGKPGKPKEVKVTASLGIAHKTDKRKIPREVLQAADKALYKAKGQGRNRVVSA